MFNLPVGHSLLRLDLNLRTSVDFHCGFWAEVWFVRGNSARPLPRTSSARGTHSLLTAISALSISALSRWSTAACVAPPRLHPPEPQRVADAPCSACIPVHARVAARRPRVALGAHLLRLLSAAYGAGASAEPRQRSPPSRRQAVAGGRGARSLTMASSQGKKVRAGVRGAVVC